MLKNLQKVERTLVTCLYSSSFGPLEFIKLRVLSKYLRNKINEIWSYKFNNIECIYKYIGNNNLTSNLNTKISKKCYKEYIKRYWKLTDHHLKYLNYLRQWSSEYNHFIYIYNIEDVKILALIINGGIANLFNKIREKDNSNINKNIVNNILEKINKNNYKLTVENPMWSKYIESYIKGNISDKKFDTNLQRVVMYNRFYNKNMNIIDEKLYNIFLSKILEYGKNISFNEVQKYVNKMYNFQFNINCLYFEKYIDNKYCISSVFPRINLKSIEELEDDINLLFSDKKVYNYNVSNNCMYINKIIETLDKMLITYIKLLCKNTGCAINYSKYNVNSKKELEKIVIKNCEKYDNIKNSVIKYLNLI